MIHSFLLRFKQSLSLLLPASLFLFTACVSTQTEELAQTAEKSGKVVLNISSPDKDKTRAGSDHKLRYTAKLYFGNTATGLTFKERQEIIEGDVADNKIEFEVPTRQSYTILVFADYIPSTSQLSQGSYGDYYYNTQSDNSYTMNFTPQSSANTLTASFFNNDYYDCFSGAVTGQKPETLVEHPMTLKRAVAKVRFADNSGKSGNVSLSVSKLEVYQMLMQSGVMNSASQKKTLSPSDLSVYSSSAISPGSDNLSDILYFYTFATEGTSTTNNLNCTFTLEGASKQTYEVKDIRVQQNYVTTVKGDFLTTPLSKNDDQGNGGSGDSGNDDKTDKSGNVILYLSTSGDWNSRMEQWQ